MSFMEINATGIEDDLLYAKHDNKGGTKFILGSLSGEHKDISDVNFIADFANAKIGWNNFEEKDTVWQENTATPCPNESELINRGYKRCFQLWMYNSDLGVKCWQPNSFMEWTGFLKIAQAWENDYKNRNGKLAVIGYEGAEKVTLKKGIFYRPVFKIKGWTERPGEFTIPGFSLDDALQNVETKSQTDGDLDPESEVPF